MSRGGKFSVQLLIRTIDTWACQPGARFQGFESLSDLEVIIFLFRFLIEVIDVLACPLCAMFQSFDGLSLGDDFPIGLFG